MVCLVNAKLKFRGMSSLFSYRVVMVWEHFAEAIEDFIQIYTYKYIHIYTYILLYKQVSIGNVILIDISSDWLHFFRKNFLFIKGMIVLGPYPLTRKKTKAKLYRQVLIQMSNVFLYSLQKGLLWKLCSVIFDPSSFSSALLEIPHM